jgi:chromosome segregation ATPase
MMNDPLNSFLNEMQSNIIKITEKTNTLCTQLDKMEERFLNMEIKLEASKLIHQEKIESSNYKLSVLEEKINANNQKVNDLNNILMKHFAYKNNKNPQSTITPQTSIPQTSIPQSNSTIPQTTTTTIPNPFAMPNFGAK